MEKAGLTAGDQATLGLYGLDVPEITAHARRQCYAKGELICHEGEPLESLLILTQGRCKVFSALGNGKYVLLGFYNGEGKGLLGDMEFLTTVDATSDVVAVTPCVCLAVPLVPPVVAYLNGSLAFNRAVAASLAAKFRLACENNTVRLLTSLEERLCTYIHMTHENGVFRENLTELASLLATSYRHLMRTLRALCDAGVLKSEGGAYTVQNAGELARRSVDLSLQGIQPRIG